VDCAIWLGDSAWLGGMLHAVDSGFFLQSGIRRRTRCFHSRSVVVDNCTHIGRVLDGARS
jgi:hypothetical protein